LGNLAADSSKTTLAEWIKEWLEAEVKPHREPKTYDFYEYISRRWINPKLGGLPVAKITVTSVNSFLSQLEKEGVSANSRVNARRTLRVALSSAVKRGLVATNVAHASAAPRSKPKGHVHFTAKEIQALLTALEQSPILNLIRFCISTGVRSGEAMGLTWSDVDLDLGTASIRTQIQRIDGQLQLKSLKTEKSRRELPIVGLAALAVMEERLRQDELPNPAPLNLVFLNAVGTPFDHKYVNKFLHRALEQAGLPKTGIHALRHSAATFMLMNGLNLHQVSRFLGHSQIGLTSDLYGHVLTDEMRSVGERLQTAITR
jgi:integrase